MRWGGFLGALVLFAGSLIGPVALAGDWQVTTVSGSAYRLEGKAWVRVAASDEIALGQMVKTLGSGALTLKRAGVTVAVAPNSRVLLSERPKGKVTEVLQTAGSAEVEVDPTKHIHLTVETPYMAAAVKGTVFTVATTAGYSQTFVKRGRVAVIDVKNRLTADITEGQTATSGPSQRLALSGFGTLEAPKPFKGKVYSSSVEGALTKMTSEQTGKTDSSTAGATSGSSDSGNSDSGTSTSGSSTSGSGTSGNSDSGNDTDNDTGNGTGNSGNAGGTSGNGHSGHGGGNGHGNGPGDNSGHGGGGHPGHGGGWH